VLVKEAKALRKTILVSNENDRDVVGVLQLLAPPPEWDGRSSEEEIGSRRSRSLRPSAGKGGLELKDSFSEDDSASQDSTPVSRNQSRRYKSKNRGLLENDLEYDDSDPGQKKARRKSALKARAARARKTRIKVGGLA